MLSAQDPDRGRRDRIRTLRKEGGLSGFTKRSESEYDPFGAAHSSTSISAGLGMAEAAKLSGTPRNVVSVIGDGSITAGMTYEAMNNAGGLDARQIVILNDNDMSIAPLTGAMSHYLARLVSGKTYRTIRETAKHINEKLPKFIADKARKTKEYARGFWTGGTLFKELGFYYVGPIDGHNLDVLLPILRNLRDSEQGPILIHVVTEKGKGYAPAEGARDKLHAVARFNVVTGERAKSIPNAPSYTKVFGQSLVQEAQNDDKIVGIAEQHAVTFAGDLASEGYKPFCAIYSTFLQRAYDQVVHDVSIQQLPVRFPIDRAGFVGADVGPMPAPSTWRHGTASSRRLRRTGCRPENSHAHNAGCLCRPDEPGQHASLYGSVYERHCAVGIQALGRAEAQSATA